MSAVYLAAHVPSPAAAPFDTWALILLAACIACYLMFRKGK